MRRAASHLTARHLIAGRLIAITGLIAIAGSVAAALPMSAPSSAATPATSYAYLSTSRSGSAVYINALVKQSSTAGIIRSAHRTGYLQRQVSTGWQTVLSRVTDAKGLFTVGFISVPAYHYRLVVTSSASALATTSGTITSSAQVVRYSSCAAVHAVPTYAHGIGRPGAVDHVSGGGAPVTGFFLDSALYQANSASLDRDRDGIACEQH